MEPCRRVSLNQWTQLSVASSSALRLTKRVHDGGRDRAPSNTDPCPITLNGIDANGNLLNGALELFPGQSATWYKAPAAAVAIIVGAWDCPGAARYSHTRYLLPDGRERRRHRAARDGCSRLRHRKTFCVSVMGLGRSP
jgi:hypothetical protein